MNRSYTKQEKWDGHSQQGKWYKQDIDFESHKMDWSIKKPVQLGLSLTRELVGGTVRELERQPPWGSWDCGLSLTVAPHHTHWTISFIPKGACIGIKVISL